MSNTNILAVLQRDRDYALLNEQSQMNEASRISKIALQQHQQITALESELAAAIAIMRKFDLGFAMQSTCRPELVETSVPVAVFRENSQWLDTYDARQLSTTEPMPPVIPPERAEAVARINQRHTYYLAMLASRHEREREETEDWYRRAMNAALNEDENGV